MKKVSISEAVGEVLGYDITEVNRSNNYKGVAFKRGHVIQAEDLTILQRLGKNHIYVWEGSEAEVHEDTAALLMGPKIAGVNIRFDDEPHEGKISFFAETRGIFKVDKKRLELINALAIPSLPTIHNNFPVVKGKQVAAFRIIPLTCARDIIDRMSDLLEEPLISVNPYKIRTASILVTGNEVHSGRIIDDFTPTLTTKLKQLGVEVNYSTILPDVKSDISQAVKHAAERSELVLVTGGTSVDPDDVTVAAMKEAGVQFHEQGNPIQPGNNLTIGRIANVPVCAVPAAALFFDKTALDIFLPRLLAGEAISPEEIAKAGHGGLCHFCPKCHYPICPFGWGNS
jgi:molybdenum cofactor synthesis domain-containing protein